MLYGIPVGALQWDTEYNRARFEYAPSFISRGIEPSPIKMPVRRGKVYTFGEFSTSDTFKGLPGMFADSLPDTYGRALFERWLSMTGRQSNNPVESLCFLGKRCMGALEFEPAIASSANTDQLFEINSLVEVAADALKQKENFSTNLSDDKKAAIAEILQLGTSAGGQRAKALIAYNKATGEVRSGQIDAPEGFDHYLIKLDGVSATAGFRETQNYGRLEYSFSRLVKKCGIDMTESGIIEENGRAHFITKRFDRQNGKKVHTQTLCGIAHYDFHLLHGYSYEQAFDVMRTLRLPYPQAQEMFRRMVFNVVARNQDDHTKNISFLMDKNGTWRLSPAYDMSYAYNPQGAWTSAHQMSVNGKFTDITRADLLECAAKNNIKNAKEIIDNICDAAAQWPMLAKECGVPQEMTDRVYNNMLVSL